MNCTMNCKTNIYDRILGIICCFALVFFTLYTDYWHASSYKLCCTHLTLWLGINPDYTLIYPCRPLNRKRDEVRLRFRVSHRRRILTDEAGTGLKRTVCPTALSVRFAKLGSCIACKFYANSYIVSTILAWHLIRNVNLVHITFLYTNCIIAHLHVHSHIFDLA